MSVIGIAKSFIDLSNYSLLVKGLVKSLSDFCSRSGISLIWDDMVSDDLSFVLCSDPTMRSHHMLGVSLKQESQMKLSDDEMRGEQLTPMTVAAFESFYMMNGFLSENFHFRVKSENIRYADFAHDEDRKKNLVFIGRGVGNVATARVCRAITKLEYHFWDPVDPNEEGDRLIKNSKGEVVPQWSRVWDKKLRRDVIDIAMVVKAENPYCPGKKVLIIAGAHGQGTVAAVKFLTDVEYLNILRKEFKKREIDWKRDFQFFVEQKLQLEGSIYVSIEKPKIIKDSIHNLEEE